MKIYSTIYFIVLYFSIGLQSERFINNTELCEELSEMSINDQKYRGSSENPLKNFDAILDSLILMNELDKDSFLSLTENEQKDLKQEAWGLARKKSRPMMAKNDSLRVIQLKIDEVNTRKLIQIVKKRGWVTSKTLDCKEKFKTVIIFRHAPKKFWKEIRPLIEIEKIFKENV